MICVTTCPKNVKDEIKIIMIMLLQTITVSISKCCIHYHYKCDEYQMYSVIQHVTAGNIVENVIFIYSANLWYSNFQYGPKLIAQAYDETVVMGTHRFPGKKKPSE